MAGCCAAVRSVAMFGSFLLLNRTRVFVALEPISGATSFFCFKHIEQLV